MWTRGVVVVVALAALAVAAAGDVAAQGPGTAEEERGFLDALRREDPATADRYVALRDARTQAIAELQRLRGQYNVTDGALRPVVLPRLRQAERRYAETSMALLDFLDARDRRALQAYQEQIGRITGVLEERRRARAELETLLQGR